MMTKEDEAREQQDTRIKLKRYKCFSADSESFSLTSPFTVIFGPNGSGKSALLEIFKRELTEADYTISGQLTPLGALRLIHQVGEHLSERNQPSKVFGVRRLGHNIQTAESLHVTLTVNDNVKKVVAELTGQPHEQISFFADEHLFPFDNPLPFSNRLSFEPMEFLYHPTSYFSIASTRKISPENGNREIDSEGVGITSTLLSEDQKPGGKGVAKIQEVVDAFNTIVEPHEKLRWIRVPKADKDKSLYEIELVHAHPHKPERHVLLSQTGSGFQTILIVIMVMVDLIKPTPIPHLEKSSYHLLKRWQENVNAAGLSDHYSLWNPTRRLLLFEELEAHLHPKTIRKLLMFLKDKARPTDQIVLTTHSPTVLDFFANEKDTQILDLRVSNGLSTIRKLRDQRSRFDALSELGVRPSDICFSNAVIWVEGPSDRIYINWLLSLYSSGKLKEGTHYTTMWFGGSSVKHVTFKEQVRELNEKEQVRELNEKAHLMAINPNSYLVLDSDIYEGRTELKKDTQAAFRDMNEKNQAWISGGFEFENYLPLQILKLAEPKINATDMPDSSLPFTPRTKSTAQPSVYKELTNKDNLEKVPFALKVVEVMREKAFHDPEVQALHNSRDLDKQMRLLVSKLCEWNNLNFQEVWAYQECDQA